MPSRMPNWKMRVKARGGGQADDEALQDAEPRIALRDAHQPQDRIRRHETVGVEHQREIVIAAPARAELADVAGLVAGVDLTPAVDQRQLVAPLRGERRKRALLRRRNGRVVRVAQHIDAKAAGVAGRGEAGHHRLQVAHQPFRVFVADAEQDRGRCGDRRVVAQRPRRRGLSSAGGQRQSGRSGSRSPHSRSQPPSRAASARNTAAAAHRRCRSRRARGRPRLTTTCRRWSRRPARRRAPGVRRSLPGHGRLLLYPQANVRARLSGPMGVETGSGSATYSGQSVQKSNPVSVKLSSQAKEVARSLWYVEPGRAEIREEALPQPAAGEMRVRTLHSAISRGTESLVQAGRVPPSEYERMRAPAMAGHISVSGEIWLCGGRPRRTRASLRAKPCSRCIRINARSIWPPARQCRCPRGVTPQRAVLAANMETALNAVWDAGGRARRIASRSSAQASSVRWSAYLCGRLAGAEVTLIDIDPSRAGCRERAWCCVRLAAESAARLRRGLSHQRQCAGAGDAPSILRATRRASSK